MSAVSGEAAEQVVRMSLEGTEMAVKLAGSGAKQLAILLYAVLKDQKKTSGKIRLANMLRSGKELKVFAIHDHDLPKFCGEAKKYGVLFTVLKDRDANDGLTDIMVRAEDASKINRIFERFKLSTVDMGSVKAQIEQEKAAPEKSAHAKEESVPPKRAMTHQEKVDAFIEEATRKSPTKEEEQTVNPTEGRTARSHQSAPFLEKRSPTVRDASNDPAKRPSVKKQLEEIRRQQKETAGTGKTKQRTLEHKPPKKKRKKKGERA